MVKCIKELRIFVKKIIMLNQSQTQKKYSRYYGLHLSIGKGFKELAKVAKKLEVTAAQIHPTAPQRWNTKPIEDIKAESLVKGVKDYKSTLRILNLHAIYLINLAQADKQKFHLSKVSIVMYLKFCEQIKDYAKKYNIDFDCIGTVVHPGSAKHYTTQQQALDRVVQGINWIFENSDKGIILLETSAGAGQIIGDKLNELKYIYEHVHDKSRLGFCIDTQHMWASGYDFVNKRDKILKDLENYLGIENIKLIHLNNSATDLDSHKDRHANLKEGIIPLEDLHRFITLPQLKHIPVVLETPACKNFEESQKEVEVLQSILE